MQRKLTILSALLMLALPGVASAQTQAPNCEYQGGVSDLGLGDDPSPPAFVAWGNSADFQTYMGEPGSDNGYVEVSAADPSRPIAHPYKVAHANSKSFQTHTVEAAKGDGPIRIVVSWQDTNYQGGVCREYSEATVQTGEGRNPPLRTQRRGEWIYPAGSADCATFKNPSVRIVVWGERTRESLLQPGICTAEYSRKGNSRYFNLSVTDKGASFVGRKVRTNDDWRFRYKVYLGGKLTRRGFIKVKNHYERGYRVYGFHPDGSINDEYWNYCVNSGQQTWMHNGNPYCWSPAYHTQRIRMR